MNAVDQSMQDKYSPTDVERTAREHWQAMDAYKFVENARDAQGNEK